MSDREWRVQVYREDADEPTVCAAGVPFGMSSPPVEVDPATEWQCAECFNQNQGGFTDCVWCHADRPDLT